MSFDHYFYESSLFNHSSPEIISCDGDLFLADSFPSFCDSSTEIFQEFSNNQNTQNPLQNSNSLHKFSQNMLSSSPPSHQLEDLSLYQTTTTHFQPLADVSSILVSGLDVFGVKSEECQMSFNTSYNNEDQIFMPHSYTSGIENATKIIQRSYSSNCFEAKPDFHFQPQFDTLLESSSSSPPNYHQKQTLSPPESTFLATHLRRACSTGDLQNIRTAHTSTTQRSFSSPSGTESSFTEGANFKVGKYSAEERKDRISKYRAKRTQRNFTKTIKYACRKTLADNRPRIRGRFARNDETGEIPKAASSNRQEDEDELWFDGVHGEEDDALLSGGGGDFLHNNTTYDFGHQFQYYGY